MLVGVLVAAEAAGDFSAVGGAFGLGKGAILGAMIVGAAFLAGMAVLKRSAAATCGLIMLACAMALQAIWLGLAPEPPANVLLLLQGLLAGSVLFFLSATIGIVGRNQLLGGVMFAGALSMIGIGVINALLAGEASGLLRLGVTSVAIIAVGLSAFAGMRGDLAARLILPGAAIAALAPLLFGFTGPAGALSLAPPALFAVGVLMASLVAIGDFSAPRNGGLRFDPAHAAASFADSNIGATFNGRTPVDPLRVSENQLAEVLDYAGIAVWDWNKRGSHQTPSFSARMGADSDGAFSPETLKDFIHPHDRTRFEEKIYGAAEGDGGFDEAVRLHNNKTVRMRGARAVDAGGALERIVVFLETAKPGTPVGVADDNALKLAAASLTAAAAAVKAPQGETASTPAVFAKSEAAPKQPQGRTLSEEIVAAIDGEELAAAFQPIVSFDTGEPCGAEALLRWPKAPSETGKSASTEEIVRLAQEAGKGGALATMMLRETADHVAARLAAGEDHFFGAFNVSLSQVRERGFVDEVRKAIADRKLPKGALVLELTEGERLGETPKINDAFKKLRAAGAALAYDDFGAGFSSLSNLHRYDFDYLKIDKSFIDDIVANGGKKKIVAALARLGRDFNMTVIAEGIESKDAAEIAKAIGCKMGQGYHLGEPAFPEAKVTIEKSIIGAEGAAASGEPAPAGEDVLVLDHSLEVPKKSAGLFKRRLFSRR